MKIAVIDDSIEESRQLSGFIDTYFSKANLSQHTTIFNTAVDFLGVWRREAFDLVFIDIFLKHEASGIRIAERVRKEDDQCTIIFTTSSTDFALKGYEVRALDYMLKPITYDNFCETMEYFSCIIQKKNAHYIEVKESRIMVKLPVDDILYTDYYNHYIQIHLTGKIVRTYMRFEDFSGMLLCYPQFACCYRNCIINMDKVISLDKGEFIINTGERLPITRSLRSQIHQQYADYQFQKLMGGIR
ncbi:MAG: LytTR family DNA-binding domain-containing protein [Clostridium sp.]|nr:LytTR family DNA-binding domain-containing protein [Clostridium sp.]